MEFDFFGSRRICASPGPIDLLNACETGKASEFLAQGARPGLQIRQRDPGQRYGKRLTGYPLCDGLADLLRGPHPTLHVILIDLLQDVQEEILTLPRVIEQFGRPRVDTLKGSRHGNMKGLRFSVADGERRLAFAFDPGPRAILLVAGDKSGGGSASSGS